MSRIRSISPRLVVIVIGVALAVLASDAAGVSAATSEVQMTVLSRRVAVVPDGAGGATVFVAGEVKNTSTKRVTGFVTVGLTPGPTGGSTTLSDLVLVGNLAPGARSGFLLSTHYVGSVPNATITFATAGGYVNAPVPAAAVGVDAVGSVELGANGGDAVLVEVRNSSDQTLIVDSVVATFYGSNGKAVNAGSASLVDPELDPGETAQQWVETLAPHVGVTAQASVNAHLASGPGSVVAWTNWFHDIGGSSLWRDIAWLAEQGITGGCAPFRYCPSGSVTRGQMAAFLDRALDLPPTAVDYFSDDESSTFEGSINRLAASGITGGCGGGKFCPTALVTRGQMASFLARAFSLPSTATDYFSDDETSTHEHDINRLAASGITGGCGGSHYCPTAPVTRAQMAAFLHRAMS